MSEAKQMKESFSHKTFSLTVAPQCLTDLSLISFSSHLMAHRRYLSKPDVFTFCLVPIYDHSIPTFRFPSPDRKSEKPASVARSPTKVIPGLSSTNALTAASVTCNIHRYKKLLDFKICVLWLRFNQETNKNIKADEHTCFLPETSKETRAGRIPGCPRSWRATSEVNCLSSLMSRCCMCKGLHTHKQAWLIKPQRWSFLKMFLKKNQNQNRETGLILDTQSNH